jgi:hypothetical protein
VIDKALQFIEREVNAYFDARFGPATQKWVTLGNIARFADSEGGGNDDSSARALMTLVNIEEDRVAKSPEHTFRTVEGVRYQNPEIPLNLYVLFTATSNSYTLALQTVAMIMQCFQGCNVFASATNPRLDASIDRLILDLFTLNFEQINHLWSTLGGKYLPSVLYRVRMVGIVDSEQFAGGGLIREVVVNDGAMNRGEG